MFPLVRIDARDFDLDIALAYATPDNFTTHPVYRPDAGCWLHAHAARGLARAVDLARPLGLRLRVLDAYRPTEAQWALWSHTPDPEFLADPKLGSAHSRGVAVDLDLLDRASGTVLDMGTAFDEFTPRSHHARLDVTVEAQRNRLVLAGLMAAAGWEINPHEWWHYQLPRAREDYPLLSDAVLGADGMMGLAALESGPLPLRHART
ncbi:D-alanyl-D-alanine dipeptidase [Paramagnetospirillum marisnigri]|uniref:D-alanyl-D-alanine dipeptidase n=1 Tax=Paramagnetospirillum marisnigri TaxID=1285242 RepID=A0A178MXX8_9PROT|nr:D-alanyl-D-alanine dipeptidase [Paramagnetospirillum marisnigri]OAN54612.1 D-alanyl-D-alanine dipeptidase [Paramagnetospirillum marisnigri]